MSSRTQAEAAAEQQMCAALRDAGWWLGVVPDQWYPPMVAGTASLRCLSDAYSVMMGNGGEVIAMSPALKRLAADLLASAADGLSRLDNLRWPTYLSADDRRAVSDAVNALGDPGLAEDYAANRTWGPRTVNVMACLASMLRAEVGQ